MTALANMADHRHPYFDSLPPRHVGAVADGPNGITTAWVLITPEMARDLLAANVDNRRQRRVHIARLAHDLSADHFAVTHQGIALDRNGTLRDGQHRLAAVIEANRPFWFLVTWGVDTEAQRHMDRGAGRLAHDFLQGPNATVRTTAARCVLAIRYTDGEANPASIDRGFAQVSDGDVYALFEKDTGLAQDLADLAQPASRASRSAPFGPGPLLAAAVTFADIGEECLDLLATGANLEVGSPLLALRNYQTRIGSRPHALYTALRVFDAVMRGNTFKKLPVAGVSGVIKVRPR